MQRKELVQKMTRQKLCVTALILFLGVVLVNAQTKESALADAKITAQATLKGDFKTVLDYTHPNVLKASGGIDVLLPQVEKMMEEMKTNQGFVFKKAEVSEVSKIVEEQGEYRCFVKNLNVMEISGQTYKSTSYLMGFYLDDGDHWVFVEAEKMKNPLQVQAFFPNFKTDLDIPKDTVEILE